MKRLKKLFCMLLVLLLMFQSVTCLANEYEYDDLDRVKKVTYDDGTVVEYTYDSRGNIETITTTKNGVEAQQPESGGSVPIGTIPNIDEPKKEPTDSSKEKKPLEVYQGIIGQIKVLLEFVRRYIPIEIPPILK